MLPLGRPPLPWQAVGYLESCDIPAPGDDEETSFWREYLLFNSTAGFAFLVDSNNGWSWVQGEFYWRIERDERARVTDFEGTGSAAAKRPSREKTRSEVTWSAGETLMSAAVAEAFTMAPDSRGALQRDIAPTR